MKVFASPECRTVHESWPCTGASWTRLKASWREYRAEVRRCKAVKLLCRLQRCQPIETPNDGRVHRMIGLLALAMMERAP